MLDSYRLTLQRIENNWHIAHHRWRQNTCGRIFLTWSGILLLLTVVGFVLTFTVCPPAYKEISVLCSFFPVFVWCVLVAISLAGMQSGAQASARCMWCSNCLWNCFFKTAFWSKSNVKGFGDYNGVTELNTLFLNITENEHRNQYNSFDIPHELSEAKARLADLTIYNKELAVKLPQILKEIQTFGVQLPVDVHPLIVEFLIL